ncbi:MAG: LytTR family DNA-binding domain-containing protein [Bacteroidales bacterium]|nr:LytTR family DNA-binding domain-containing protein [Bacteroidales bacterium]
MNRYIIIEDDVNTVQVIKGIADKFPELEFVGSSNNVQDSIKLINENEIHLCFADVQLLDGTSFDIFSKIPNINFQIIFITAHESYAIKAIKMSALDYILKPINENELIETIENFLHKNEHKSSQIRLQNYINSHQTKPEHIIIASKEEYEILPIKDIEYLESDGCYTKFIFINQYTIVSSKPIGFYEEILEEYNFIRIHQQYLVNFNQIKSILKGQPLAIKLKSETILPVTRYNKSQLMKLFVH